MSDTTQDTDEFEQRWKGHVSELTRLRNTLPMEEWDRLKTATDELNELVELSASQLEEAEGGNDSPTADESDQLAAEELDSNERTG